MTEIIYTSSRRQKLGNPDVQVTGCGSSTRSASAESMEAGSCIKLGATLSEEGNEQVGTMAGICGTTGRRKCGIKL